MNLTTSADRQAGWSLPIIWIILVLSIGVFYLFSWIGLAYLVGFLVLTCIITYIYDMFQRGHETSSISEVNFWFESGEAIEQVAELLVSGFKLHTTSIDAESARIENERYTFSLSRTYNENKDQGAVYHLNIASDRYHLDEDEKPYIGKILTKGMII